MKRADGKDHPYTETERRVVKRYLRRALWHFIGPWCPIEPLTSSAATHIMEAVSDERYGRRIARLVTGVTYDYEYGWEADNYYEAEALAHEVVEEAPPRWEHRGDDPHDRAWYARCRSWQMRSRDRWRKPSRPVCMYEWSSYMRRAAHAYR